MSGSTPQHGPGRTSAVAIYLAVLTVMAVVAVAPWIMRDLLIERIEAAQKQTNGLLATIRQQPRLRQRRDRLRQRDGASAGLLPANDVGSAVTRLQSLVISRLRAIKLRHTSIASLPTEDDGPFTRVRVEVAFDSNIVQLRNFLYRIETGLPALTVRALRVRKADERDDGLRRRPTLRVRLIVQALTAGERT